MKLKNPFKQKVQKSFRPSTSAYVYMDNQGNIIDTVYSTKEDEIRKNASINTIISKQSSIIDEAALVVKEKNDKADTISKNPNVNAFVNWIEEPNSIPSPTSRSDIFYYLLSEYLKVGISGMVFTFKGGMSVSGWKNIKLPQKIEIYKNLGQTFYRVWIDAKTQYQFQFDPTTLNLTAKVDGETLILYVFGNYDLKNAEYCSRFDGIFEYILLQNYLIKFATSFHKNACFPSQIVQLTYKNLEAGEQLGPDQMKEFEDAVNDIKDQLQQTKGVDSAGRIIVPNHPALEIKITPLSIPTNADDNIKYHNLVSDKIFSFVDGGSSASFEGRSEYANNASAKLLDLYDGTFRMANSIIIKSLTRFMKKMFVAMMIPVGDVYLSLDKSTVVIYQDRTITQTVMITQNNLMTINEGKKILAKTKEEYGDLDYSNPEYDVVNAQIGGKLSQAPNV